MILAIDQGTTGTTCFVFDEQAEPIGRAYREITQSFPQPGWVEHDPREIWEVTHAVAGEALADAGVRCSARSTRGCSSSSPAST
jgi:glycerol kinase